jgi:hypothetical protein
MLDRGNYESKTSAYTENETNLIANATVDTPCHMGLEGAVSVLEEVKKEKIKEVAPRGPIVARLGTLLGPKGEEGRGPRKGPKVKNSLRRINL